MGFQQGLSGLNSASKYLDVIGNNVANSNTVGFKSSRAEFADLFTNSLGSNSTQTGIGGRTSTVAQQFSQGNLSSTNSPLDLAIQGNGFYRVLDSAGSVSYTRNGQFQLDRDGFIVNNGQRLAGYGVNSENLLVTGGATEAIQIQTSNIGARATGSAADTNTGVELAVNLDARSPVLSRGNTTFSIAGLQLDNVNPSNPGEVAPGSPYRLRVADSTGGYHTLDVQVTNLAQNTWQVATALDAADPPIFSPVGNLTFDNLTGALTTAQPMKVLLAPTGAPPFNLNLNFSGTVQGPAATAVAGVASVDNNASAKTTVAITKSNLNPLSAATTAVNYPPSTATPPTLTVLSPAGNAQTVAITLTKAGENTWTPVVSVNGAPFEPVAPLTIAPLVFDAKGNLVSGSPLTVPFTTNDAEPVDMSLNVDFSGITQASGPTTQGNITARNTIQVTPTDPTTFTSSTSATVYDAQGVAHTQTYYFTKVAPNTWEVQTKFDDNPVKILPEFITFKGDGTLSAGSIIALNSEINAPDGATSPLSFITRLNGSTQYGSQFGVNKLTQDGYSDGTLTGLSIGKDGVVQGRYSNGQNRLIGQIVLYNFANPQGLQSLGDSRWAETFASNQARQGVPGSSDFGAIQSGTVEDANVDLTKELVDMITAQRTYQANAQTIKTQDQILQTIVNLR